MSIRTPTLSGIRSRPDIDPLAGSGSLSDNRGVPTDRLPIFVFEGDRFVYVFDAIEDAEGALEAIDVEDGAYPVAFDAEGLVFEVGPRLDNAELIPAGRVDRADLCRRPRRGAWSKPAGRRPIRLRS